ncbi:MAG: ABC transporter permease [Thiobacillaceae bacterium]|jgi:ABC-2 type transport system permease protein|nr:ABC transporter permease [Thiobacillaceae bacterium]
MSELTRFRASVMKDARIIARDRQALILFFVMPVLFVLILSLALRDAFGDRPGATFPMLVVVQDQGEVGRSVVETFRANPHIGLTLSATTTAEEARRGLIDGTYRFAVLVPAGATEQAQRRLGEIMAKVPPELRIEQPVAIRVLADPALRADYRKVLESSLDLALHGVEMKLGREQVEQTLRVTQGKHYIPLPDMEEARLFTPVHGEAVTKAGAGPTPTSVQQNAPAWTLLAMFFLTVPLSVSFIKEREQGSLFRLQTMTVPAWVVLGGKAVPFFVINLIQMASILAVSVHILPLLGGDRLDLGNAPLALLLVGASASVAAIGFGIAVAMYARTTEQAASFSSATVMIMAALGGILVPKAVMPPLMQDLAVLSPLAWGLDGFLDVFVRGGGVADVLPEALGLLAFAAVCLGIAILRYRGRI